MNPAEWNLRADLAHAKAEKMLARARAKHYRNPKTRYEEQKRHLNQLHTVLWQEHIEELERQVKQYDKEEDTH